MKGNIELISSNQVMVGVKTENGDFSVLELIGGYSPELGDIISGNLEDIGGEVVFNRTQGETWDVFIQDILGSKESAWKIMRQH